MFFNVVFGGGCSYNKTLAVSGAGSFTMFTSPPWLYVVDEGTTFNGVLKIYDMSNPASPSLVSTTNLASSSGPKNPYATGNLLLIPYRNSKQLAIWDVTDRSSPSLLSTTTMDAKPNAVAVIGTNACVVENENFLQSYTAEKVDISNPSAPVVTLAWRRNAVTPSLGFNVSTAGNNFVITGQYGSGGPVYLSLVDSSTFLSSGTIADSDAAAGVNCGANAVSLDGTLAFVEMGSGKVWAVDISNPASPTQLDKESVSAAGGGPIAYNDATKFLYVGRFAGGGLAIYIVDATTPSSLTNTGTISTSSETTTDIEIIRDSCAGLAWAQGTGAAIHLLGNPPLS